ncbi:Hypothetical predicted protein [Octopus vulgaris]|uniref:Uncharacterized protein n=1 Tax=Octopus vulgaris TaxID=6645 RepID=A0AA36FEY8_OCTVU|nr:Hypothetical predicted protein [Octopus vulgaris]
MTCNVLIFHAVDACTVSGDIPDKNIINTNLVGDGLIPIHMVFVIAKSYHMMEEINEANKERLQRNKNER